MLTWSMLYTASIGCFGWAVAQETAAQSTRPKTISFTVVCQQLTGKYPFTSPWSHIITDFISRLL
jgi:hypothetical protein